MASPKSAEFAAGRSLSLTPLEVFGGQASAEDLDNMVRVFAAAADRPDLIPQTFLGYIVDYIQTANISVAVSQITGQTLSLVPAAAVTAAESTTATAYAELGTVGPELSNLQSGYYVVLYGAQMKISATADEAFMSPSINGNAPLDADAAVTANTDLVSAFALSKQLLQNNSNSIELKYRASGGTATFGERQLIAIRYANL